MVSGVGLGWVSGVGLGLVSGVGLGLVSGVGLGWVSGVGLGWVSGVGLGFALLGVRLSDVRIAVVPTAAAAQAEYASKGVGGIRVAQQRLDLVSRG